MYRMIVSNISVTNTEKSFSVNKFQNKENSVSKFQIKENDLG